MGIGEAGELLRRSTVHIRSSGGRRQSSGSGVIWDSDGTVITNAHVLGKGSHSVELWDGRTVPAELEVDSVSEVGKGILKLRFLRGDRAREREVAISMANRSGREGA